MESQMQEHIARKERERELIEELLELRRRGISKDSVLDTKRLLIAVGCPSNNLTSFDDDFVWAIRTHVEKENETNILLLAYGLTDDYSYEDIPSVADRRKAYCEDMGALPDTMLRTETKFIKSFAKKLAAIDPNHDRRVPFDDNFRIRQNEYFVGRTDILLQIHKKFQSGSYVSRIQLITGMGGIGKTQTAQEYAFRYKHEYDLIVWVNAETTSAIFTSLQRIMVNIGTLDANERNPQTVLKKTKSWMETNDHWLFIFDNVEDFEELERFLPRQLRGHILLTARVAVGNMGELVHGFDVFSEKEAVRFFRKRVRKIRDDEKARELSELLGYFPLALEQAAAFIETTPGSDFPSYIDKLKRLGLKVLDRPLELKDYKRTVREAMEITLSRINELANNNAIMKSVEQFMFLCSYLAPDDIPIDFFADVPSNNILCRIAEMDNSKFLPEPLRTNLPDELSRDEILRQLQKYSILKLNTTEKRGSTQSGPKVKEWNDRNDLWFYHNSYTKGELDEDNYFFKHYMKIKSELSAKDPSFVNRIGTMSEDDLARELEAYKDEKLTISYVNNYSIHRLLQEVVRDMLVDDGSWLICCVNIFANAIIMDNGDYVSQHIHHALQVADYVSVSPFSKDQDTRENIAEMYLWYGYILCRRYSNRDENLAYLHKAVELCEKSFGKKHFIAAASYLAMAEILKLQEEYELVGEWRRKAEDTGALTIDSFEQLVFGITVLHVPLRGQPKVPGRWITDTALYGYLQKN